MVHVFVPDHSVQCKYRYVGVKKKNIYIYKSKQNPMLSYVYQLYVFSEYSLFQTIPTCLIPQFLLTEN